VLERKHDPGEKLHTTGIIVKEAAERTALHTLPRELVQRVDRVRLYSPNLNSLALAAPGYYFWTTDTPNVMRWLAERLRAAGVVLRLGSAFTGATRCRDGWRIDGVGTARYLIGADGAKSRVAAHAGLGRVRQFLYGVEHEFPGAQLPEPDALHCFVSKRYAPGYIGWVAQNPTGVQLGLALRHDPQRTRLPDIEAFLTHVRERVGLSPHARRGPVRAGLIPCGGPVSPLAAPGVILTGDAAGIVSPVTAGGIHSAWQHGWTLGHAIAAHLQGDGPEPERVALDTAPRFRIKRALRWAFDRFQYDWPFDLLLHTAPLRWAAERVYFHKRGAAQVHAPTATMAKI
jgi:flavin-dependent dehydrogenase